MFLNYNDLPHHYSQLYDMQLRMSKEIRGLGMRDRARIVKNYGMLTWCF